MADGPGKIFDERGRIIAPGIARPDGMTPVSVRLPSLAEMSNLDPAELLQVAQAYGVYSPWDALFAQNQAYVANFSRLPPTAQAAEVERITAALSERRAALGLARASARGYNQILATDGDENQILVRVGEGDDAMCDGCIEREGTEGTLAEHEAVGLPGSQECGQNCRCVLIPVDTPATPDAAGEAAGSVLAGVVAAGVIAAILGGDEDRAAQISEEDEDE